MSGWQPLDTAPISTAMEHIRVLVYGECGVQMGYVYDRGTERSARAEGFNGDWKITLWHPLPEPPKEKS